MGTSRPRNLPGSYTGNITGNESFYVDPPVGEGRSELFTTLLAYIQANISSSASISNKSDISDMLVGTYDTGGQVYVTDASADGNIPSGWALYKYDGGGTTSIGNYSIIISEYWLTATYQSYDNSTSGLTAATTKEAIDELKDLIAATATGLKWKEPVDLATTANITLSGEQTIDGTLTSATRILVKDQTDESENGIYVTGAGVWTRATDLNEDSEVSGFVVHVLSGSANGDTTWQQSGAFTTLDTDDIILIQFSGAVPNWSESVSGKVEKATQAEAEANTDDDRGMTPLKSFQQFVSNIASYTVSALTTTSKFIVGAINELKSAVDTNTTNIGTNTTNIGTNTTDIATNTADILLKADLAGGTSGDYLTDDGSGNPQDSGDSKASQGQAEVITGHSNIALLSVLRAFQFLNYHNANYSNSILNTTSKNILGAINELKAASGSGVSADLQERTFSTTLTSPAGQGEIRVNSLTNPTEIYIHEDDLDGDDYSAQINLLTNGSVFRVIKTSDPEVYMNVLVTSQTDNTGSHTIVCTLLEKKGDWSTENGSAVSVGMDLKEDLTNYFNKTTDDEDDILNKKEYIVIACSDEISELAAGTNKARFAMPFAATIIDAIATVNTAPTGSTLIVDINEEGTSILSTLLTIDDGETSSTTAATPAVISDSAIAEDAIVGIDIDQVGATVTGAGLKVTIICTR